MKNFVPTKKRNPKDDMIFDYKNPLGLYEYIDGGKIAPARINSLTRTEQRSLCNAIKKARTLGLVPAHHQAYDDFGRRPEPISPKPFKF